MRGKGWVASLLLAAVVPAMGAQDPRAGLILLWLLPVAACSFIALELILWVLAPAPLAATSQAILRSRGRCLLTGFAAAAVVLILVSGLSKHPNTAPLGALILGITALGCLAGITAVTALLGNGAVELAGRTGSRALAVVVGSALLVFAGVIPVVGWVLCVYFLLIGLGGVLQALVRSQ